MDFRNRSTLWLLALVFILPLVIYLPSVTRDAFVSIDDSLLITKNAAVQQLTPRTIGYVFTSYDPELYIPLTLFTYQMEFAIVGANPFLFHLTSLLLHCGSALLLFFILKRMFKFELIAAFGALLFALHPLNTEAVAWASALKDILSSFFFFGSLLLYLRWRDDGRSGIPWGSLVLFVLALLSKVTVAMLPFVLLLMDWRDGELPTVRSLREKLPYCGLSGLFIIIALFGKAKGIGELGLWKTGLLAAKSILFYLQNFFFPLHLSVIYAQQTPVTLTSPEFFIPVLGVLILVALIITLHKQWRDASFGLTFFLLMLLPNFANFWKNRFIFFASDRYTYIPMIGLIVILCSLCVFILSRREHQRRPISISLGAVITLLAVLTFLQTRPWATDISLYSNVLRWYPDSALAQNNLGDAYYREKNQDLALQWFTKAVDQNPSYIQAIDNAAGVYLARGQYDQAQEWFQRGIAAIPTDPRPEDLAPRYRLGELLVNLGKTEEGLTQFKAAAKALPDLAEPYFNWALQLQKVGRNDEAIVLFEEAVSLDSYDIASRYHLAGLYAEKGRLGEARDQLKKIVAINPGYEKAAAHLADIERLMQ